MSNKVSLDGIKNSVRRTSPQPMLIDPVTSENVHVNENVNVHKNKKPKFEERFTRATIFIENELLETLNQVSAGEKGEKTRIVNEALKQYLRTN